MRRNAPRLLLVAYSQRERPELLKTDVKRLNSNGEKVLFQDVQRVGLGRQLLANVVFPKYYLHNTSASIVATDVRGGSLCLKAGATEYKESKRPVISTNIIVR